MLKKSLYSFLFLTHLAMAQDSALQNLKADILGKWSFVKDQCADGSRPKLTHPTVSMLITLRVDGSIQSENVTQDRTGKRTSVFVKGRFRIAGNVFRSTVDLVVDGKRVEKDREGEPTLIELSRDKNTLTISDFEDLSDELRACPQGVAFQTILKRAN